MTPILYIKAGCLSFSKTKLLEDIELYIYPHDRICLIGRNGSGKSTLMKVIFGEYELDSGELFILPNIKIGYLKQDINISESKEINICDFVLKDFIEKESVKYKADIVLNNLQLDANLSLSHCSGGQLRRVFLARVLIKEPEILLLDEPTNHLDITTIEWLEEYVKSYNGAVICISHDRSFLSNTTNKLCWIDRGVMRTSEQGFKFFDTWQEEIIRQEELHLRKLGKKLELENEWLNKGVTARRKRNQKRLKDLIALRSSVKSHANKISKAKQNLNIELSENVKKTNFIVELDDISFSYDNKPLLKNISLTVKKGEKIGIIGPNGSGKSTFIKLLTGELEPLSGKIKHGVGIEISYIDQNRIELDPEKSIKDNLCPEGGDQVFLAEKTLHVAAYLKQFMFDPKIMYDKVSTLSGGQASRLLLAKTLIKPGNLLILDEPTNDLDMDSLEVLLEILSEYKGTLFIVSHDRDFLDRLVTRTLIFIQGEVIDTRGGYSDYKNFIKNSSNKQQSIVNKNNFLPKTNNPKKKLDTTEKKKKLSYKFQRALELIPQEIEKLELTNKKIEEMLVHNPFLYNTNKEYYIELTNELANNKIQIDKLIQQWMDIENQ